MEVRKPREDARRNREAVIDASTELLAADPDATMQDIADASGVGRTTVYRHFPTREVLFEAMFERAILRAREVAERALDPPRPSETTLRRYASEMIGLSTEFRFLALNTGYGKPALQRNRESPESPVRTYLREAQARGELRADLPLQWMTSIVQALVLVAMEDQVAGHADEATAKRQLGESLIDALLPREERSD